MTKYPYVDYSSGESKGAIHLKCHEQRARRMRIPVFFHNFRGYDSHLVVRALGVDKNRKLDIISQGMEKYLVIRWGNHIEFKDTLQFLGSSLDNLTKSLLQSGEKHFSNLRKLFPEEENFKLLLRKGVYPYDWVDDWKKLEETNLPSRESFFNKLRNEACSIEDYAHAHAVWEKFNCTNFREYMSIYLKCMFLIICSFFQLFETFHWYKPLSKQCLHYFTNS